MTPDQRAFLDGLRAFLPDESAEARFRRVVQDRWDEIVVRVEGRAAQALAQLPTKAHQVLRMLEDTPSLLGPLSQVRDERSHTRLLAWALSLPGQLGDDLRRTWLKAVGGPVLDKQRWTVRAERPVAEGRVDVEILIPGRWRCYVEAKVDAGEGFQQLARYRASLRAASSPLQDGDALVFLTLHAQEWPSDETVQDDHVIPLRWHDLLAAWLPLASGDGPDALYLRCWLMSVADLADLRATGPFATWPLSSRLRVLRLLTPTTEAAP